MRKIGRNELCPCGSGKKHKKCCGHHSNNNIQDTAVNNELYQIHQELISYTTTEYKDVIDEQYAQMEPTFKLDDEMKEIHHTGVAPWIVSSVPCFQNKETVLHKFYQSVAQKLSPYSKEVLESWFNVEPSIYQVVSINYPKQYFVQIKELGSNHSYLIPYQYETDFAEDMLLIGTLVPFVSHHDFLLTMIKLVPEEVSAYVDLLDRYKQNKEGLKLAFPQLVADMLRYEPIESNVEWEAPIHKEIADVLAKHLSEKGVETSVIDESTAVWNTFCTEVNPTIKKVEPYAAAMDYYTCKNILKEDQVKQADIAKEYQTSASTLSNVYRRIVEAL